MSKAEIPPRVDAHLEPTVFHTHGTLADVIQATLDAIADEQHIDVLVSSIVSYSTEDVTDEQGQKTRRRVMASSVAMGPTIGALKIAGVVDATKKAEYIVGYTRNALSQIAERTHSATALLGGRAKPSPSKFVDVALWARPKVRATLFQELLEQSGALAQRPRLFRLAVDAHNPDPSQRYRYLRALVSEGYSAKTGDDAALIEEMKRFALNYPQAKEFLQGRAWSTRDPAGETGMVADSARKLPNNARLTMRYTNNEIGEGAARVGLSLTFEVEAQRPVENEFGEVVRTRRIEISIPGTRSAERATHHGGKPGGMFGAFGEKLAMVLGWAPSAIEKLANGKAEEETRFAPIFRGETGSALRTLQHEVRVFTEALVTQGIATRGSALLCALVLSEFGHKEAAGTLVEEICGRV